MIYKKNNLSKIRWTVDTENDLRLIKNIVMEFHPKIHFSWLEIYKMKRFN
jgi:spore coat polysaccharide biosynthesis protein SpsF (cytidylyltransferase family)